MTFVCDCRLCVEKFWQAPTKGRPRAWGGKGASLTKVLLLGTCGVGRGQDKETLDWGYGKMQMVKGEGGLEDRCADD